MIGHIGAGAQYLSIYKGDVDGISLFVQTCSFVGKIAIHCQGEQASPGWSALCERAERCDAFLGTAALPWSIYESHRVYIKRNSSFVDYVESTVGTGLCIASALEFFAEHKVCDISKISPYMEAGYYASFLFLDLASLNAATGEVLEGPVSGNAHLIVKVARKIVSIALWSIQLGAMCYARSLSGALAAHTSGLLVLSGLRVFLGTMEQAVNVYYKNRAMV